MEKYVNDVSKDFDICTNIEKTLYILYYISVILTISICIISFNEIICYFLIIIHIIYVILNAMNDLLFKNNAESERRKALLSNSFNSNLTNRKTNGFYNNDEKDSFKKLGINMFESVLFSKNNSKIMLFKQTINLFVDIIIWLTIILLFNNKNLILCITQCVFSSEILIDYCKLLYFHFKSKELYNKTYILFVTNKYNNSKKDQLLQYVIEYECLKSYSHILLSEKSFIKNNFNWSTEWNNLKKEIR